VLSVALSVFPFFLLSLRVGSVELGALRGDGLALILGGWVRSW
jgi:hypothetical protein